jgi:hypothetical protein
MRFAHFAPHSIQKPLRGGAARPLGEATEKQTLTYIWNGSWNDASESEMQL